MEETMQLYDALKKSQSDQDFKVDQYTDKLKESYNVQLTNMLNQYTQKLHTYEDRMKEKAIAIQELQAKLDKAYLG